MHGSTGELGLCAAAKLWVHLGLCALFNTAMCRMLLGCCFLGHLPRAGLDMVQAWEILMQLPGQVLQDAVVLLRGQQRFMSKQLNEHQLLTASGAKVWFYGLVRTCPLFRWGAWLSKLHWHQQACRPWLTCRHLNYFPPVYLMVIWLKKNQIQNYLTNLI